MKVADKPLVWLHGEVKTPPFSREARLEAGYFLRLLQMGEKLSMPQARTMASISSGCYELRVNDKRVTWRIIYRVDADAIIILEVFTKKSEKTPKHVINICKRRLAQYDSISRS